MEQDMDTKERIILRFREHPVFFLIRFFIMTTFLLFFYAIFLFIENFIHVSAGNHFLVFLLLLFLIFTTFVRFFAFWRANVNLITEEELVIFRFSGIFNQSREARSLSQFKTIDIKQNGFWKHLLGYGDIDVASVVSGSTKSIVLRHVGKVKKVHAVLSRQANIKGKEIPLAGQDEAMYI